MGIFSDVLKGVGSAAAAIGGGTLQKGNRPAKETRNQKTQRQLVDQLLASVQGQGPYSDLFNADQETFQKSYVDPAKHLFKTQIAPEIQQKYIATGQQRSTGLDDSLTRAGVDLDMLLNQQYGQFQESAMNRKQNAINSVLNVGQGAAQQPSGGEAFTQAVGGYAQGDSFKKSLDDFFSNLNQRGSLQSQQSTTQKQTRRGYAS